MRVAVPDGGSDGPRAQPLRGRAGDPGKLLWLHWPLECVLKLLGV